MRERKGVGGQHATNTTQPIPNTSVVVPHHAPHPVVSIPFVCPVCGSQDQKCLRVIVSDIMGSDAHSECETTEDQWHGECGGREGACEMMVWCGWLKRGKSASVLSFIAFLRPSCPVCGLLSWEGKKGFWRVSGQDKEKRKRKKEEQERVGKKGETQIHFQKKTQKQKAQLTLAD